MTNGISAGWKRRYGGKKDGLAASFPGPPGDFPGCQYSSHDGRFQPVLAFDDVARVVVHSQDEYREGAFLVEGLLGDSNWQDSVEVVFAVGGFVAVLARVPGVDADLVVVVG